MTFDSLQWLLNRGMAVIFGIAFMSLKAQVIGLYGKHGILPIQEYISSKQKTFFQKPTLFLYITNITDLKIMLLCKFGVFCSICLFFDILPTLIFGILNYFGLFGSMTTTRNEIHIEGSMDGKDWRPYELKYKPGDLDTKPPFIIGHLPRLEWRLWFSEKNPFHSLLGTLKSRSEQEPPRNAQGEESEYMEGKFF
eukprot:gene16673-19815_t